VITNCSINKVEIIEIRLDTKHFGPQKKCLQANWVNIESISIFYWDRADGAGWLTCYCFCLCPCPQNPEGSSSQIGIWGMLQLEIRI